MPTGDDYEQHRLLVMIEQMQREGRSQREIEAAVRDATRHRRPAARPSPTRRPAARRPVSSLLSRLLGSHDVEEVDRGLGRI